MPWTAFSIGLGDLALDDLRRGARVGRDDEGGRELQRRQQLLLERRHGVSPRSRRSRAIRATSPRLARLSLASSDMAWLPPEEKYGAASLPHRSPPSARLPGGEDRARAAVSGQVEGAGGGQHVVGDGDRRRGGGDRPLRVLEPVAGDRADDRASRAAPCRRRPAAAARPRWPRRPLDEDADLRGRAAGTRPGSRRSVTASIRPPDSSRASTRLGPGGRVADPDRGGDGLRVGDTARRSRSARRRSAWKPHICGLPGGVARRRRTRV